jgi:hypothetical protein
VPKRVKEIRSPLGEAKSPAGAGAEPPGTSGPSVPPSPRARPVDLYELLKRRQDQLRGRPETRLDRFRDWLHRVDWADFIVNTMGTVVVAELLVIEALVIYAISVGLR